LNETRGYDYQGYPKLLITDFGSTDLGAIFDSGVCVKECPTGSGVSVDCKTTSKVEDCNTEEILGELTEMIPIMNICIPTNIPPAAKPTFDALKAWFAQSSAGSFVNDLNVTSQAVNVSIVMAVVYSLFFIYFMSYFGETIAWICVFLM